MAWRWLTAMLLLAWPAAAAEVQRTVVDLAPRAGVSLRLLMLLPPQPKAAALLFTGGPGVLNLGPDGKFGFGAGNFLMRARMNWVGYGIAVGIPDAPSDRKGDRGLTNQRTDEEHARDVAAAIAALNQASGLPVWLIGTSQGTLSAANGAARLAGKGLPIAGLVLTSTMLDGGAARRPTDDVFVLDLDRIEVPTLVVHHAADTCGATPPSGVNRLLAALKRAPKREALWISGGDTPRSEPCEAFAAHGYIGVEASTVGQIVQWMGLGR